jgi:hypothetical protein
MPRGSKALNFIVRKSLDWGSDCYPLPAPQEYIRVGFVGRRVGWVACSYANGLPENGQIAINDCGSHDCVNGSHWHWGTWDEAMSKRQFRSRKGGKNPNAKLTEADVAAIRAIDFGPRNNRRPVAEKYGISLSTLHAIVKGWTWKGVAAAKADTKDEF